MIQAFQKVSRNALRSIRMVLCNKVPEPFEILYRLLRINQFQSPTPGAGNSSLVPQLRNH